MQFRNAQDAKYLGGWVGVKPVEQEHKVHPIPPLHLANSVPQTETGEGVGSGTDEEGADVGTGADEVGGSCVGTDEGVINGLGESEVINGLGEPGGVGV